MTNEATIQKEVRSRLDRVQRALRSYAPSAILIVCSATRKSITRDLHYNFHQDSDFYYLTESVIQGCTLVVGADGKRVVFAPEHSKHALLWEGRGESAENLARRVKATLLRSSDHAGAIQKEFRGMSHLFYPNGNGQAGFSLAQRILSQPSHQRGGAPISLTHSDAILEPLRLRKSPYEIAHHKKAVEISHGALLATRHIIAPGVTERLVAETLEHEIRVRGGEVAFPTIVGGGENGATLHHTPSARKLKKGELVLIDFGASYQGYAADITRMLGVGGAVPQKVQEVYDLVLSIQEEITRIIKPNKDWRSYYERCSENLLKGLRELKVLRGDLKSLRKKGTIKEYFPHSLGHTLGLDVHDVGGFRSQGGRKLAPGMLLTVEPGLYFPKSTRSLPAFGIRIEDDILVTRTGAKNLTEEISKALF
ncbi:MAG: aminopeptidase P N-terminal domain-containing protein [Bdellovibrionales bacterium]|nr:aminopeptidase P N-terminal domain-containing protein [Bdellovibrionales bacterium]